MGNVAEDGGKFHELVTDARRMIFARNSQGRFPKFEENGHSALFMHAARRI